jgi:hypothetical protein
VSDEGPTEGGPDGRVVTVLLDVLGLEVRIGAIREWRNPDIDQVDALARLALQARRKGWSVKLQGPCGRMVELLDLFGLGGIVTVDELADATRAMPRRPVTPVCSGPWPGRG